MRTMTNAQETGEVLLALVSIEHDSIIGGPLRFVQDLQDLTSNGNTYTAFPFEVQLPPESDDAPAKVLLKIDTIDRQIAQTIRSISPASPPTVTVALVVASQPDTVEISMSEMTLRNVSGDAFTITGELFMDEDDLLPFPEGIFSPGSFPGVFK